MPGSSTGSGTPQGSAGDPTTGTDSNLVPYSDYLAQYAATAQSEVDRELIPADDQQLVREYFQNLGS